MMRQKPGPTKEPAEQVVKDIRRATRKHYSAEEKIRIVLEGLRARTALPSSAAGRASRPTCTTAGPRASIVRAGMATCCGS
jgi:transposase